MHITIWSSRRIDILCNKSKSMTQHSLHLSSPPGFNGVRVTRSLILCVMFCRSLLVLLYFFYWPLCCLFFFDIPILITPLVFSNSSLGHWVVCPSSIYKFLLPLWYLQTLLDTTFRTILPHSPFSGVHVDRLSLVCVCALLSLWITRVIDCL